MAAWKRDRRPPPRPYQTTRIPDNLFRFADSLLLPPSLPDGTHVAGILAGTNFGVAKRANIYCVKVLEDDGIGSTAKVISGLNLAVANTRETGKPSVISISIRGPLNTSLDDAVCFLPVNY